MFIMISLLNVIILGMPDMAMDDMARACPLSQLLNKGCASADNPLAMTARHISLIGQLIIATIPSKISFIFALFFVATFFALRKDKGDGGGIKHSLSHAHRARSQISDYKANQVFLRWLALKNKLDDSGQLAWARVYSYN